MNKAIEEMAKIIDQTQKQGYQRIFEETRNFVQENHRYSSKNDYDKAHSQTIDEIIAEALYNAGYRNAHDFAKWHAEEQLKLSENVSKETAREILQELKEWCHYVYHDGQEGEMVFFSHVIDIVKKFGVEVE